MGAWRGCHATNGCSLHLRTVRACQVTDPGAHLAGADVCVRPQVWALAVAGAREEAVATGGGDAVVALWRDATAANAEAKATEQAAAVLKQQDLENALQVAGLRVSCVGGSYDLCLQRNTGFDAHLVHCKAMCVCIRQPQRDLCNWECLPSSFRTNVWNASVAVR